MHGAHASRHRHADLLVEYYPLAQRIARKTHSRLPPGVDADDMVSAAVMGLMDAAERFDVRRGIPFRAFAKHRIQGAVLDSLRATDWVPRAVRRRAETVGRARQHLRGRLGREPQAIEVANWLEIDLVRLRVLQAGDLQPLLSLDVAVGDEGGPALVERVADEGDLEQHLDAAQRKHAVVEAIEKLPERERAVIVLAYFRELTLREAGEVLGVTESRVCQLLAQAIGRLKFRLRGAGA